MPRTVALPETRGGSSGVTVARETRSGGPVGQVESARSQLRADCPVSAESVERWSGILQ